MSGRTPVGPVSLPVDKGQVTANYGQPRKGYRHKGVDLAVPVGTPVTSTVTGRVTRVAFDGDGYGNYVEVTAADGTAIRVAHLNSVSVRQGQVIRAGERVGSSGNTGRSSGPHVHYEVLKNGKQVDPLNVGNQMVRSNQGGAAGAVASPQGNTMPNVPGPVLSADDQNRLRVGLDRDQAYYPNYLNDFHNVTYHVKFFMVDPATYQTGLGEIGDVDPTTLAEVLDTCPKVVIAETGVTAGLNVKSLRFKCIPKNTGTAENETSGTEFDLTIVEPLGTSFYDVTVNASNTLGIASFQDSPYFLELSFKGYDREGNAVTNVLSGTSPDMDNGETAPPFPNNGRWVWMLNMKTVETNVTEEGSVHSIKLVTGVPGAQAGIDGRTIPEMIMIRGNTVGEFLDDLAKQLNDTQARRYPTSFGSLFTYEFKIEKNSSVDLKTDPRNWSLVSEETLFANKNILSMEDGKATIQVPPGNSITDLLKMLFSLTKEGQRYAINGTQSRDETISGGAQAREQVIMWPRVDVQTGEFNYTWRQHAKKFVYRLKPMWHNSALIDPRQVEEAKQPAVQKEMVKKLREKGFFRKRFDYYYTGLNTEIKNLDIKFEMHWGAVLPNVIGYGVSQAQATVNDKFNTDAIVQNRKFADEMRRISNDRVVASKELATAINEASGGIETQRQAREAQERGQVFQNRNEALTIGNSRFFVNDEQAKRIRDAQAKLEGIGQQEAAARQNILASERSIGRLPQQDKKNTDFGTQYAEDLTEEVPPTLETRFVQSPANTGDITGIGGANPYHRDKAVFGALMEQLVGNQGTLMKIDLDVRGDPYWMGTANIERTPDALEQPNLAPYDGGEVVFLLKVSYPFQASDATGEYDGQPNFRTYSDDYRKDAFTGFYRVLEVDNIFENGEFSQKITAARHSMIEVAQTIFDDETATAEGELGPDYFNQFYTQPSNAENEAGAPTQPANRNVPAAATSGEQDAAMKTLYGEFIKRGWTREGALAMVAQVGRENNFGGDMYGEHTDANNKKTNIGIISFQGDRRTKFIRHMTEKGFYNNGQITRSPAALAAQAEFIDKEMKQSYPGVSNLVRKDGVGYSTLEPALSNQYVGWDRAGKKINPQPHLDRQSAYYQRAKNLTGGQ